MAIAIPAQHTQLFWMRNIETVVEQLLAHREDGRVGADRERQRRCCDQREPRTLAKYANPVADVGTKFIKPAQSQRCAHAFLVHQRRTQRDPGASSSFSPRVAGANKIGSKLLKMPAKLGFHLGFKTVSPRHGAQP